MADNRLACACTEAWKRHELPKHGLHSWWCGLPPEPRLPPLRPGDVLPLVAAFVGVGIAEVLRFLRIPVLADCRDPFVKRWTARRKRR